jgi:hypothetical protein
MLRIKSLYHFIFPFTLVNNDTATRQELGVMGFWLIGKGMAGLVVA